VHLRLIIDTCIKRAHNEKAKTSKGLSSDSLYMPLLVPGCQFVP